MKSPWGIVIALGGTLVALLLAMRFAGGDAADESNVSARDRQTIAGGRLAVGTEAGAGPQVGHGATPPRAGSGAHDANGADKPSRRRLRPPIADARRRRIARGGATDDVGGAKEHGDQDAPVQAPLTDHASPAAEAPPADAPPAAEAAAADVSAAEPTDVVYYGADRVFDTQSQVGVGSIGAITPDAGAMSFWLKPEWESGDPDHANFVQLGENGLRVVKDGKFLRFEYNNAIGNNEVGGTADTSEWPTGDWRHVTATWQDGMLSLYVDGQEMYVNVPGLPPPVQANPKLYIGSVHPADGQPIPPAQLTGLLVMGRSLSSEEVQDLFQSVRAPER
jgi:hypothetical protein